MKRHLMLVLWLAPLAFAQQDPIREAESRWTAAIQAKDGAALEKLLDDRLIYAHSTGIVDSKKEYIEKVTSGRQRYEGAKHESMKIHLYGDTAIMHGQMRMWGVNQNGKFDDRVMTMHTWVKQNGVWKLVAHQTTKLR